MLTAPALLLGFDLRAAEPSPRTSMQTRSTEAADCALGGSKRSPSRERTEIDRRVRISVDTLQGSACPRSESCSGCRPSGAVKRARFAYRARNDCRLVLVVETLS